MASACQYLRNMLLSNILTALDDEEVDVGNAGQIEDKKGTKILHLIEI